MVKVLSLLFKIIYVNIWKNEKYFVDNKLYESYMSMICTIFKEVGKYLVIILLVALYNTFNKYVKDTYFGYAPQNEVPLEKKEKKKVEVYKDEEETDNL